MNDIFKMAEQAYHALSIAESELKRLYKENAELRQALAQSGQKPLGKEWVPCVKLPIVVHVRNQRDGETYISTREGITPVLPDDLIMRGVAGEQYPIGRELFERTYTFDVDAVNISQERVDETAKCKHEPVARVEYDRKGNIAWLFGPIEPDGTLLYTAPPKREWVGLTDEEIYDYADKFLYQHGSNYGILSFGKAVEARLKEKNGG